MATLVTMKVDTLVDPHKLFLKQYFLNYFYFKRNMIEGVICRALFFSCVLSYSIKLVYAIMLLILAYPVIFNKLYFRKINQMSFHLKLSTLKSLTKTVRLVLKSSSRKQMRTS